MNKAFYIIGTDTSCGKTLVTGAMAAYLQSMGRDVGVMKPFESACEDSAFLKAMAGCNDPIETINPYHYDEPLAPAVAAERAGLSADFEHVITSFNQLRERHDILLAEGAGGLLVPLVETKTHVELLKELRVPVLLVARLGLGTINHTLLTMDVLKRNYIPCYGVILNETTPASSVAEKTNPQVLSDYYQIPLLGTYSHLEDISDKQALIAALPDTLKNYLNKL